MTGLCDGEASFTYGRKKSGYIALCFAIKMIGGDRPLLNSLRAFFGGAGHLHTVKATVPGAHSGYTKEAVLYKVSSGADLERVVDHFDAYPMQGAKARSYKIWREMVLLKRGFLVSEAIKESARSAAQPSSATGGARRTTVGLLPAQWSLDSFPARPARPSCRAFRPAYVVGGGVGRYASYWFTSTTPPGRASRSDRQRRHL